MNAVLESKGVVLSLNNFEIRCFVIQDVLCAEKLEYAKFLSSSLPEYFGGLEDTHSAFFQRFNRTIAKSTKIASNQCLVSAVEYTRDLTFFIGRHLSAKTKRGTFIALKLARQLLPSDYTITNDLRVLLKVFDENSLPQGQLELNRLSTSSATAPNFCRVIFLYKAHIDQLLRRIQGGLQAQLAILVTLMK